MSNDWSDDSGSNDNFGSEQSSWGSPNTTGPGQPGASWQDDPSAGFTPMGPASIGDVFNNFGTVASRSLSSGVVWAFTALIAAQLLVMCGGLTATVLGTVGLSGLSSLSDLGANPGLLGGGLMIGMLVVMALSMLPQLFMAGLFNPMQSALFEGQQPHHGFKWALGKASENILDIFLMGALYIVAVIPAIGLSAMIAEWAVIFWLPVMMVAGFLFCPALYYVATGNGVIGSLSKAFQTVTSNLVLFVLFFVLTIGVSLVFGCMNAVLSFIPILGFLASLMINVVVQYLFWAFYVSTIATVESHELGRPIY